MQLNEVFVEGQGDFILAYKEYIWRFEDIDEVVHYNEFPVLIDYLEENVENFVYDEDGVDLDDILQEIRDSELPIIYGELHGTTFEMGQTDNFRHSSASKTLEKMMLELDIEAVSVPYTLFPPDGAELYDEVRISREEVLKPLAEKSFYHGTTLTSGIKILSNGIQPNPETNFKNILHEDKIFLTLNLEKAMFHATHASWREGIPCILKLRIPDVNKLVLDYDVALQYYGTEHPLTIDLNYEEIAEFATGGRIHDVYKRILSDVPKNYLKQISDKSSLNTKLGNFGYIGRIPAKFIEKILVSEEGIQDYVFRDETGEESGISSEVYMNPKNMEWMTYSEFVTAITNAKEELDELFSDDEEEDL